MTAYFVSVPLRDSSSLASPVATGEVASTASRWGRLCLAFISDAMKVYSLRPWRPLHRLRGPPPPLWQGRLEVRSVLLRGYDFEIVWRSSREFLEGKGFRPLAGIWF